MGESKGPHAADRPGTAAARPVRPILVVEDHRELGALVKTILEEEGYSVATVDPISDESIRGAVEQLRPSCILLDGGHSPNYAQVWATAATLRRRRPPVRTVMFTADTRAAAEARNGSTSRAAEAGFAAVLTKPFTIEELVATIDAVVSRRMTDTPH